MRTLNLFAAGAMALCLAGATSAAAQVTISNAPDNGLIGRFGFSDSQTYGEVFTAPVSGSLDSFTMYLHGPIGGTLYGGIGVWNGSAGFSLGGGVSSVLYTSDEVAADHAGAYTFAPGINLMAGQLYVAYLSVFGVDHDGQGFTSMPLGGDGSDPCPEVCEVSHNDYFNYFVWNNDEGQGNGPDDASWNYFADFGNARLDATFNAVPEPATWALMIGGFGMAGAALRRRRALALV